VDEREDFALEGGEVDELAVLFVPLAHLALSVDVRSCSNRVAPALGAVSRIVRFQEALSPLPVEEPGVIGIDVTRTYARTGPKCGRWNHAAA